MTNAKPTSVTRRTAIKAIAGAATAGGVSGIAGTSRADPGERTEPDGNDHPTCDFGRVFDDVVDSLVTIRVFDEGDREFVQGSGWVYELDGSTADIVTNWHVVAFAFGADARFSDGDWRPVFRSVGVDRHSDLAVLRVEDVPEYVEPLSVADAPPDQGDEVAALGAPIGLEETITTGTVSAVDRSTTVAFEHFMYAVPRTIQTDAAINPGNSGGPLVDCDGELVGVNFAGTNPLIAENVNFAISTTMVQRIVPEIVETGRFDHSYMGIQGVTVSPMISRMNDIDETTEGVYVEQTVDGFPADVVLEGSTTVHRETGVPVGGDVIVGVDGTDVDDTDTLRNYLFDETRPDDRITLSVLRDGDTHETPLTLTAKPDELERIHVREPTM